MANAHYQRVLLKISGEALMGDAAYGISPDVLTFLAKEIKTLSGLKVQLGIVVGAGNIFRGVAGASTGMDRAQADNMGMLATAINALAIEDALNANDVPARVLSAIAMANVCEPYTRAGAIRHLNKGRHVIFAAGTANPYFTTDTAAVLRALEINADIIFKATRVDGVYDKDPLRHEDAVKFDTLTHDMVLRRDLKVMDATAAALARDNNKKIMVFNMTKPGNIKKAVCGEEIGTLIEGEK